MTKEATPSKEETNEKKLYYRSYPSNVAVFTLDEIEQLLFSMVNNRPDFVEALKYVSEFIHEYADVKLGKYKTVALTGEQIRDVVNLQNLEDPD